MTNNLNFKLSRMICRALNDGFEYPSLGIGIDADQAHIFTTMVLEAAFEVVEHFAFILRIKRRTASPRTGLEATFVGMFGANLVALRQQVVNAANYVWVQI